MSDAILSNCCSPVLWNRPNKNDGLLAASSASTVGTGTCTSEMEGQLNINEALHSEQPTKKMW